MKDIKDYLHLYWGCEVSVRSGRERCTLIVDQEFVHDYHAEYSDGYLNDPKLILRPLSDMTEEEQTESERIYAEMMDKADEEGHICDAEIWAEHSRWLISKSFDVFQLIESGIAIDKTTLK